MADICIFCGKEMRLWQSDVLTCGGVQQPVCRTCSDQYAGLSQRQRGHLALKTGRAQEPERIQAFLDQADAELARDRQRWERQQETLLCCGQRMAEVDKVSFLSQIGFIQTHTGPMLLFRCDRCGQMKLFDASFFAYTPSETEIPALPELPDTAPSTPVPGKKPPWEK